MMKAMAEPASVNPLSLTATAAATVIAITIMIVTVTVTANAEDPLTEPLELPERHGHLKDAATRGLQETQAAEAVAVKMNATAIAAADADNDRNREAGEARLNHRKSR